MTICEVGMLHGHVRKKIGYMSSVLSIQSFDMKIPHWLLHVPSRQFALKKCANHSLCIDCHGLNELFPFSWNDAAKQPLIAHLTLFPS